MVVTGVILLLWGVLEGAIYLLRMGPAAETLIRIAFALGTAGLILGNAGKRARGNAQPPGRRNSALVFRASSSLPARLAFLASAERPVASLAIGIVAASAVLSLILALVILSASAISADEFGYRYLAETLSRGRLWNPASHPPLHDIVQTPYVPDKLGKRLSQYPPAWPLVLAPYNAAGVAWLANPLVALLGGAFMLGSLRAAGVGAAAQAAALALALLAPFELFNAASLFNHTLAATAILAVVWLDLRDAKQGSAWNRAGIGLAFSVLLGTRYEAFSIAFGLFACDHLIRRRTRFVVWALPAAAGALPGLVLLGLYDWRITGSPLTTTLSWGFPGIGLGLHAHGINGTHSPARAMLYTFRWSLGWADFASVAMLPLYVAALWRRTLTRSLRWFDLMLPAVILFFVFYPDYGGFQYGPRYWFIAHALVPLTIAIEGGWRITTRRFDPLPLAALQATVFLGFTLGYGAFARIQAEARLLPLRVAEAAPSRSAVLFPSQADMRYVGWQLRPEQLNGKDFTRNGPDGPGRVLLGLDLGPQRTRLLCRQMTDRTIYRLEEPSDARRPKLVPACG